MCGSDTGIFTSFDEIGQLNPRLTTIMLIAFGDYSGTEGTFVEVMFYFVIRRYSLERYHFAITRYYFVKII